MPAVAGAQLRVAPNPLVRSASIDLVVPGDAQARVRLRLYDVAGRLQRLVYDAPLVPGRHEIAFEGGAAGSAGGALAPGVYFLRADIDGREAGVVRAVVTR